ncbi:flagellar L-ring family protein [Asticcacaulis biprosthecium C19]|uniref:Flagellar L-ring protein n=1 Tax=Asticcacaulis biprosthecium C19 TaxID=715226 RepID=F4QPD9_9CAUL|nr:flagellar basal body L-ring protein FlgH [Asticcacaulis biprosthecium]EGF91197.1 flagellar L-ring family protein [Asticcacaulis biprosthecium C19]
MKTIALTALAFSAVTLGACGTVSETVKGPQLTAMAYPVAVIPAQQAVIQPAPASSNSLWRAGARTFFNDQRARNVGDILTIQVDIDDSAQTQNSTDRSRTNSYEASTPSIFGLESSLGKLLPSEYNPTRALGADGSSTFSGNGSVQRSEKISVTLAATVTGVMRNGNLVIQGHQEVRTGREMRVLSVAGIVRPEDISSTNTIRHTQLAEARISYGGKGDITNMQQAPVTQNIMDKFSPF